MSLFYRYCIEHPFQFDNLFQPLPFIKFVCSWVFDMVNSDAPFMNGLLGTIPKKIPPTQCCCKGCSISMWGSDPIGNGATNLEYKTVWNDTGRCIASFQPSSLELYYKLTKLDVYMTTNWSLSFIKTRIITISSLNGGWSTIQGSKQWNFSYQQPSESFFNLATLLSRLYGEKDAHHFKEKFGYQWCT